MVLPGSGQMAASAINGELGRASTTSVPMNGADERDLAKKPTSNSQISYSDFYGKFRGYLASSTGATVKDVGGYRYHIFYGPGTFTVSRNSTNPSSTIEFVVVGGGGGGGVTSGYNGTGGGGGGQVWGGSRNGNLIGTYPVSVGGGGAGASVNTSQGGDGSISLTPFTPTGFYAGGGGGGGSSSTGARNGTPGNQVGSVGQGSGGGGGTSGSGAPTLPNIGGSGAPDINGVGQSADWANPGGGGYGTGVSPQPTPQAILNQRAGGGGGGANPGGGGGGGFLTPSPYGTVGRGGFGGAAVPQPVFAGAAIYGVGAVGGGGGGGGFFGGNGAYDGGSYEGPGYGGGVYIQLYNPTRYPGGAKRAEPSDAGTGGGGGGGAPIGSPAGQTAGNGGSGIIIFRYTI